MKKLLSVLLVIPFLLTGCSGAATSVRDVHMSNPLVAEEYWTELTQTMVDLILNEKADLQKQGTFELVDGLRQEYLKRTQEAIAKRKTGLLGSFVSIKQNVGGVVLVEKTGKIYLSANFLSDPGPSLHWYLTEANDPRDGTFPDSTALDIGEEQSPYSAQTYSFNPANWRKDFRTLALYDKTLKRLYGFAQLSIQP